MTPGPGSWGLIGPVARALGSSPFRGSWSPGSGPRPRASFGRFWAISSRFLAILQALQDLPPLYWVVSRLGFFVFWGVFCFCFLFFGGHTRRRSGVTYSLPGSVLRNRIWQAQGKGLVMGCQGWVRTLVRLVHGKQTPYPLC